ncbi:zinc carboxypeptidase domain-containing protein [Ditylenchus destructor]|uniref:Zinc carboxypeptidase domain-containing protein n=1 Tax=Ditylenchus destructor TaxID=166010 RepID=A0AAD4QSE0_9BILA|nr:zinc carboxypeptidase domain-containing protein [Ditylenchus destructor]
MKSLALALVSLAFAHMILAYKDYTGYQLLSVVPNTSNQLHALQRFEKEIVPQNRDEIIVEEYAYKVGREFKVLVSPKTKKMVADYLKKRDMNFEILMEDFGRLLEENKQISEARKAVFAAQIESQFGRSANINGHFDQYNYHNIAEIEAYLSQVAAKHNDFVKISSFGQTQEGRNLTYLKIGYPSKKTKYAFFLHATIHAREWITTPMTLLFIHNVREVRDLTKIQDLKGQLFMLSLDLADFGVNRQLSSREDDRHRNQP